MIGIYSFIIELIPILILLFILVASIYNFINKNFLFSSLLSFIFLISFYLVGFRFFYLLNNHNFIENLNENDISYIQINRIKFDKKEEIQKLLFLMKYKDWYSPSKERFSTRIYCNIVKNNGNSLEFYISKLRDSNSTVINFIRKSNLFNGYFNDGYAYCPKLINIFPEIENNKDKF